MGYLCGRRLVDGNICLQFSLSFDHALSILSIVKRKTWGWPGHVIDVLAVLATIFGLATSLGLGAQQAASGLNYLFGWDFAGNTLEIIIIILVTGLATISVARGINGGVKFLSNVNMLAAGLLLLFVFL